MKMKMKMKMKMNRKQNKIRKPWQQSGDDRYMAYTLSEAMNGGMGTLYYYEGGPDKGV